MVDGFWSALILLLLIIDPFLAVVFFATQVGIVSRKERMKHATTAVMVAFILLVLSIFTGTFVLDALGIKMGSFKIGGALILLIMGVQSVLGLEFGKKEKQKRIAAIIIGTPLLTGPAAITTAILLTDQFGYFIPLFASALVLFITWLMLMYSDFITKYLGEDFIEIASRVLGLLLAALAVQFIVDGIKLLGV